MDRRLNAAWVSPQAAKALRNQGRYEEALEGYRRVMELDPRFGSAHAGSASALFALGRYEAAVEAMERSIVLEPVNGLPAREVLIGKALLELGHPEELAAERFQRALAADPRHRDALDRLALLRFEQQHYQEALDLYQLRLQTDPDNSQTHSNIGACLCYLGQREAARASFERALQPDPTNESAQRNLEQIRKGPGGQPGAD